MDEAEGACGRLDHEIEIMKHGAPQTKRPWAVPKAKGPERSVRNKGRP
jgi:hypothetical protein